MLLNCKVKFILRTISLFRQNCQMIEEYEIFFIYITQIDSERNILKC